MNQIAISFVIPAFNEEYHLPNTIKSIKKYVPVELDFEIIVADNGSTDDTVPLAEELGAKVLVEPSATVAKLRNIAVEETRGVLLVFLDADVSLTEQWGNNIYDVYQSVLTNSNIITGSRCGVPDNPSWIESAWFQPLVDKKSKYINSGHLITSRSLFEKIGGFEGTLETGEDYAFGVAARSLKARIINNPLLRVVHYGYPKKIGQFVRREIWHGRGDCESINSVIHSKVALVSIFFIMSHFTLLLGVAVSSMITTFFSILVIVSICFGSAVFRYKIESIKNLLMVSALYYVYYFSRFLSCISFESVRGSRSIK